VRARPGDPGRAPDTVSDTVSESASLSWVQGGA